MDLYQELGDALRPDRHVPYNSAEGWELEKEQARQFILFEMKSDKVNALVCRAGELAMLCADARDNDKAKKYITIIERLIAYQDNLYVRYPLIKKS